LQRDWGEGSYDAFIVKKLVMYYKKKVESTLLLATSSWWSFDQMHQNHTLKPIVLL
jgi:hypothetical protein